MANFMMMAHDKDPAEAIREEVGDISKARVLFNTLLVAKYVRPNKTTGGILLTDKTRDEDLYQGKAHLVLKKGPRAFVDDGDVLFHGQNVEVGEWVVFRPSDGWDVTINGKQCRMVQDVHVKMVPPTPDMVW